MSVIPDPATTYWVPLAGGGGGGGDVSSAVIKAPDTSVRNLIQPTAPAIAPLVIKGVALQSANLMEWQDSAGLAVLRVEPDGKISSAATNTPKMMLRNVGLPVLDVLMPNNGIFRAGEYSVVGTNDIFFQGYPGSGAGWLVLESWSGAGTALGTGSGDMPITIRPNRIESARFEGSGPDKVKLILKSAAGQTADLQQWQDSSGAKIAYVNSTGQFIGYRLVVTDFTVNGGGTFAGNVTNTAGVISSPYMFVGALNYINGYQFGVVPDYSGRVPLLVRGAAGQSVNLMEWQDSAGAIQLRVNKAGAVVTKVNVAPADADISANEIALWFDPTNGAAKFMAKAKQADGTVFSGAIWPGPGAIKLRPSGGDDTVLIQTAFSTAEKIGGTVQLIVEQGAVPFLVSDTLNIVPSGGRTQVYMNLIADPGMYSRVIRWVGANNKPVFSTRGWRRSSAHHVHIWVASGSGVVGWDIDNTGELGVNEAPPATISSTILSFYDCSVDYDVGTTNGKGFVVGGSGRNSDLSVYNWHNCMVAGAAAADGHIGWDVGSANAIGFAWFGGMGMFMSKMVRARVGAEGLLAVGMHGSHNLVDFEMVGTGELQVVGGRFEWGQKMLNVTHNTPHHQTIIFDGTKAYEYYPADGSVFYVLGTPSLELRGCTAVRYTGSDFTSSLISMYCDGAGAGSLSIRGGAYQASDPFFRTIPGSTGVFTTYLSGAQKVNSSGISVGLFTVKP